MGGPGSGRHPSSLAWVRKTVVGLNGDIAPSESGMKAGVLVLSSLVKKTTDEATLAAFTGLERIEVDVMCRRLRENGVFDGDHLVLPNEMFEKDDLAWCVSFWLLAMCAEGTVVSIQGSNRFKAAARKRSKPVETPVQAVVEPPAPAAAAWRNRLEYGRNAAPSASKPNPPEVLAADQCRCGDRKRDHDSSRGRCWICGTGDGRGCQLFRQAS